MVAARLVRFSETTRTVLQNQPWLWLICIYAAMLAFHGPAKIDLGDFLSMAHDSSRVLVTTDRQFLYSSPINYIIGDLLGLPTITGFYIVHIAEILAMLAIIPLCVCRKFAKPEERFRFLALLSLTPLWLVTFKWIGKPDPLLISLLFLCWAYPGRWRWLMATGLVVLHREMGCFMCLFLFCCEQRPDFTILLPPLLLGNLFHYAYLHLFLDRVPSSRVEDLTHNIWLHPKEFIERPSMYFLTSLGWFWIVVIWQSPAWRLSLALLAAFCISVVSEDFTRDFVLLALVPLLLHLERIIRMPGSNALTRYFPLGFFQIQVAAMGTVYQTHNAWVDWMTGNLGDQLTRW